MEPNKRLFIRESGILLHPTSLWGQNGIGDFGHELLSFLNFSEAAGQSLWQVLPLSPTGKENSPYQTLSSFALNTMFISFDVLHDWGYLSNADYHCNQNFPHDYVDYAAAINFKEPILQKAATNFLNYADEYTRIKFDEFCRDNKFWLEDYALFSALRNSRNKSEWTDWDKPLKRRLPEALEAAKKEFKDEILREKVLQYLCFEQWIRIKKISNKLGIKIIGELPFYAFADSADVWANPHLFVLNSDGSAKHQDEAASASLAAAVQSQRNLAYNWNANIEENFSWWIERIKHNLKLFDILRIDHFKDFFTTFGVCFANVNGGALGRIKSACEGLLPALKAELGDIKIITDTAEPLSEDIEKVKNKYNIANTAIFTRAFANNLHARKFLPENYRRDTVAYSGNHECDTIFGWGEKLFNNGDCKKSKDNAERKNLTKYLRIGRKNLGQLNWVAIETLMKSNAGAVILQMQDLLGLGSEARMNTPCAAFGNWKWRCAQRFPREAITKLRNITEATGRNVCNACAI